MIMTELQLSVKQAGRSRVTIIHDESQHYFVWNFFISVFTGSTHTHTDTIRSQ